MITVGKKNDLVEFLWFIHPHEWFLRDLNSHTSLDSTISDIWELSQARQ